MLLTSGREVPGKGEVRQRGEGVAIVLSGETVTAWKTGGSQWKSRSSRLITVTLEVMVDACMFYLAMLLHMQLAGKKRTGSLRVSKMHALSSIPSGECFVM